MMLANSTEATGDGTSVSELPEDGAHAAADIALQRLVKLTARALGAPFAVLSSVHDGVELCAAAIGLPQNTIIGAPFSDANSLLKLTCDSDSPLLVADVAASTLHDSTLISELHLAALAAVALPDGAGALLVGDFSPRQWRNEDAEALADFAASAAAMIVERSTRVEFEKQAHKLKRELAERTLLSDTGRQRMAEHGQDIIYRVELQPQSELTYISPLVGAVLGYTPEEFYADQNLLTEIIFPEDRAFIATELRGGKGSSDALLRLRHKDGHTVWLDLRRRAIADEAGAVIAYEGIARDVTQFMRTAEALRFSEQRYRELFDAAQRQARELALLDQVRTVLTRQLDLSFIFKTVVEAITETFGYTQVSIYTIRNGLLMLEHQVGYDRVITGQPLSSGVMGRVATTGEPALLEDVSQEPEFLGAIEGISSEVCVPLFDQDRVVGVLNVESTTGGGLSDADLRLMTSLSEQISIAIDRARLYTAAFESERRYRSVVERVTEVIFQTDAAGLWTFLNPAWTEITGFDQDQSIGTGMIHYIHVDDRELLQAELRALITGVQEQSRYEIRCQARGQGFRWLEVNARPLSDGSGNIIGTSGTLNDVTDRKLAEETLLRQNEELAALHETTLGLVNQLDVNSLLESVISRAAALLGTPHGFIYVLEPGENVMVLRLGTGVFESVIGLPLELGGGISGYVWQTGEPAAVDDYQVWPGRTPELEQLGVRAVTALPLRSGTETVGVLGLAYMEEGMTFGMDHIALLSRFGQLASVALENARLYAGAQQELIERKRAEERLAYMALHDPLTSLPNRSLLHDRLHQAILVAHRDSQPMALLVMDMDRFKEVNDTLGHHVGDELLQQIGARLHGSLRASDTVARLGGDEFAVLLPGADMQGATLAARKLLTALEIPFTLEGHALDVRISIGIALLPDHGEDEEALMRRADVAMYVAKRGGSGYAFYSPEQDPYSPGRLALAGELRKGIEQDELVLYYQPKVSSQTRRVTGVEALVRWQHPTRGMLGPDQFIQLAEHTGLIGQLSQWVLSTALAQCRLWRESGIILPVAVNLSMRDLHDARLPYTVQKLLETWGVEPALLTVEITEDAVMADLSGTLEVLTQLRALGVRLAIDDFGTGQSSLAQLKRLPVMQLKIDKSFVREMATNDNDAVIVRSTIDLGHNLGMTVVAEGVEDLTTLNMLAELGCDEAQGYYLSRPIAGSALLHWLREYGD